MMGTRLGASAALLAALGLGGCVDSGTAPPGDVLNFPMDIALHDADVDGTPDSLLVVNSNFNLRFNRGTLMAFDLAVVDEFLAACAADEQVTDDECIWEPGGAGSQFDLLSSEVQIGTHTDGIALNPAGDRVYLPVGGGNEVSRQDVTFVDFADGRFSCDEDQAQGVPQCGASFQRTDTVLEDALRDLTQNPIDVVAGPLSEFGGDPDVTYIIVLLQTLDEETGNAVGGAALLVDDADPATAPVLVHVLDGLPSNPVTLTRQPGTGYLWGASSDSSRLFRLNVVAAGQGGLESFLVLEATLDQFGVDDANDSRQVLFHPDPSIERLFVLNRRPDSVIGLDLRFDASEAGETAVWRIFDVPDGPSRMTTGRVAGTNYIFVTTFNAQRIAVIDIDVGEVVATLGGLSGPFGVVVDEPRQRLYVSDFATSVLRVVDIAPLADGAAPVSVARIGAIQRPNSLD